MNKNLLFLSIVACFASFPSYASNIENDLGANTSNNTFSEAEYKKKLEEFLMDETSEKTVSEKGKSDELIPVEETVVNNVPAVTIEKETESKDVKVSEVNKLNSDAPDYVNNDNMNMIKMSSLKSHIDNLSLLLEGKIEALKETSTGNNEKLNELKDEVYEKIDALRKSLNESISSKVDEESIENLNESLSELKTSFDEKLSGFYSKEVIDEKLSQLKSSLEDLATEVQDMGPAIAEAVKKAEYENYKKVVEKEFNTLKEELVKKAELDEGLMSLKNKIEGNSLSLKEKSDVIKDLKKSIEQRVNDVIGQIQEQKNSFDGRLSNLESNANKKQDSENIKKILSEKDSVIEEQNKKIEELNKKYDALIEQIAEFKNNGFNNNVIKVENLTNLREAEKKVQEDGGVLILDKNGQLKVLN